MCLVAFVNIQERLQVAHQVKYCMQTPQDARSKKLNSSVTLTESNQCNLIILFFQTIMECLLQVTFEAMEKQTHLRGLCGTSCSIDS